MKVEIKDETIEKLENLSMLEVSDKEGMKEKLSEVLGFMENLSGVEDVDLHEVNETIYREDVAREKYDLKEFFEKSDKVVDGSFEVPKIL